MKSPFNSDLRVAQMVVSSTRKRFSLYGAGLAFVLTTIGFFLIRETQEFLSYFFAAVLVTEFVLFCLFYFEKFMIAQIVALVSLWTVFSVYGVTQGEITMIMIAGYLVLTIIAGYAFYIKGVIAIMIANSLIIILTGFMSQMGIAPFKVETLDPRVQILVGILFIIVGSAYLSVTLDMLGENYLQVREFKRRYLTLFSDSIDAIMIISLDKLILDMNPTGLELTGYNLEELPKISLTDLIPEEEDVDNILHDLQVGRKVGAFEHQIIAKDGRQIDVESIPTAVTDENGTPLYFQVHMRDVRSRKRVESHLTEFKQRYEAMFDRADYGFLLLNMELKIVAANHQAAEIINCQLADLHNQAIEKILTANSFDHLQVDLVKMQQSGDLPPRQFRLVNRQGGIRWVEANIAMVDPNDDQPQYLQWVMRDITEEKQRESHLLNALQEMETLAMTDPLTGVHNRRSIQRYGQIEMENCSLESKPFCVILIDLDGLKKINDTHGHHTGDLALSQCAQTLTTGKRRDDAVGRWGGDEFLMVLPDTSLRDAKIVAKRIVGKINTVQVGQGSQAMPLAVSMGLAGLESRPEEDDLDFRTLVDLADQSMYVAKEKQGSQVSVARYQTPNSTEKQST